MTQPVPHRPPLRTSTHRTDTLAVRKLFAKLSPDWIIRDLSERDYGIDLMLEYYSGEVPTGQIIFCQIKGRDASLRTQANSVNCQLPKKTLLYAEHFPEPFILIHTSVDPDTPIYFTWLQKYISHHLASHRPNWRNEPEESITIEMPSANTIEGNEEKLIDFSSRNVLQKQAMQYLSTFLFWEYEYSDLKEGNTDFSQACVMRLNEFKEVPKIFRNFNQGELPDFLDLRNSLESFGMLTDNELHKLDQFSELLDMIKTSILTERHQDEFSADELGESPF